MARRCGGECWCVVAFLGRHKHSDRHPKIRLSHVVTLQEAETRGI
jgi:hypothetical protein